MNLGDLLTTLAHGELRSLGIVLDNGSIDPDRRRGLVNYTNKALTRLYTRFKHEIDFLDLTLNDTIQRYWINPLHAVSDATAGNTRTRYITDTVDEPFTGGLIRILSIKERSSEDPLYDENLLMNERAEGYDNVRMMSYDKLWFREPELDRVLTLEYQKNHAFIELSAPDSTPISLYPMLEEALVMHIAGRVYVGIGGEDNLTRGTLYFREYERLCIMAASEDLLQDSGSNVTTKLADRGFC